MKRRLLALALALTACSAEPAETTTPEPTASPESTASAQESTCTDPLGKGLTEFPARDYLTCAIIAQKNSAGYSMTSTMNGASGSSIAVDMDPFWVHVTYPDGTEVIANLGDSWAKVDGAWVEGDASSDNYLIAQATQVAQSYHASFNPELALASVPADLTYSVTGTETIDGTTWTIIEGSEQGAEGSWSVKQWVGPDYEQKKTLSTSVASDGTELVTESVFTSWDTKQNIAAPK